MVRSMEGPEKAEVWSGCSDAVADGRMYFCTGYRDCLFGEPAMDSIYFSGGCTRARWGNRAQQWSCLRDCGTCAASAVAIVSYFVVYVLGHAGCRVRHRLCQYGDG